ncbi:MAG: ParB/RepB/Spo0J family partition protein [Christensenellales bacterium]
MAAKSSARDSIKLTSVDDLFSTEQERQEAQGERVVRLPLSELHYFKGYPALKSEIPFTGQPFHVRDDDPKMLETLESVKQRGVRTPGLVRPDPDGGYEIISGHRRHRASELAELTDMPVIIRELTDEEAVIELVDANIQREDVLPSEKAWAYRMKLEAIKRQGQRSDLTFSQVGKKLNSYEELAEKHGDSRNQIFRYVRLTELIPPLLQMVDDKKIALNPSVELSYLNKELQTELFDVIEQDECTPSLSQAQRLKTAAQEGKLDRNGIELVMSEEKPNQKEKLTIQSDRVERFFPKSYSEKQKEDLIVQLLESWYKKRQREPER